MNKILLFIGCVGSMILAGCSSSQHNAVPVVDAGTRSAGNSTASHPTTAASQESAASAAGSSAIVMVPPPATSQPIQSSSTVEASGPMPVGEEFHSSVTPDNVSSSGNSVSPPVSGEMLASGATLAADEQLDGPVLALLTTAQQQQSGGDLNGASANLERAQRIAPREPQVLYRLAQVRLAQGDADQAEQLARRGLTYANDRPSLQAGLWELVAKAREQLGDSTGAELARQKAQTTL